jgi:hypothetical protein
VIAGTDDCGRGQPRGGISSGPPQAAVRLARSNPHLYAASKGLRAISTGDQEMLFAKFRQYLQSQSALRPR